MKITMFYNDSDLDLNGNGIIDAGDIKEDTQGLYWHWGNDTSGIQEWFPLTLGADYSGKFDRNKTAVTQEEAPLSTEEPTLQPEGKIPLWIWTTLAVLLIAALVYVLKRR